MSGVRLDVVEVMRTGALTATIWICYGFVKNPLRICEEVVKDLLRNSEGFLDIP